MGKHSWFFSKSNGSYALCLLLWGLSLSGLPAAEATPPPFVPATSVPDGGDQKQTDLRRVIIREVMPALDETLTLFDQHDGLPDSTLIWGADKESNQAAIDKLLDKAITLLDESYLSDYRDMIRTLAQQNKARQVKIIEMKKERILAPLHAETSTMERMNPFLKTKEAYDKLIGETEANIAAAELEIEKLKAQLGAELRAKGIQVSDEAVDALVSTVPGTDFISLAIVFENIKEVTLVLQKLTEESSESPETARRYYGMYVLLAQMLERAQTLFVETVENVYIPNLRQYEQDALTNIAEAKRLIAAQQGDEEVLRSNISANQLTIDASRNYIVYLEAMAKGVRDQIENTRRIRATAVNTYKTVAVSSNVADLIRTGNRNFDKIMKLNMPQLRAFNNTALRREYEQLDVGLIKDR